VIHYHGTPISGSKVNAVQVLTGRHALISHAHPGDIAVAAEVCQSFVLDNGAFSHFSSGKPKTEWGDYYEWSAKWLAYPTCDWALIPDAIGGDAAANDRLLAEWPHGRSRGVPVYHLHEPIERLAQLASEWPRVALGSSGDYWKVGAPIWWDRMSEMMEAICDDGRPRCRLHGLRMLDWRVFTKLPLASADSANVAINCGRNGKDEGVNPYIGALITMARIEAHNSASAWRGKPVKECEPSKSSAATADVTGQQSLFSGIGELEPCGAQSISDQKEM
jgi:hypothetical protein